MPSSPRIYRRRALRLLVLFVASAVFWKVLVLQHNLWKLLPVPIIKHICPESHTDLPFVVLDLHSIIVQLQRTPKLNEQWSRDVEKQLVHIARKFDWNYKPPQRKGDEQLNSSVVSLEFCPEHFVHSRLASPYYLSGSWIPIKHCPVVTPMKSLVSIIIYWKENGEICTNRLQHLLVAIEDTHKSIPVYVGLIPTECSWENVAPFSNVQVTKMNASWTSGQIWNSLSRKVTTPYTLVGRDLEDLSWLTNLRRQVSILSSEPLVHVVAGAVRNSTGHWQVGCYQSHLYNYILEYRDGYFSSKNECMFCDHVLGPFVARTETLTSLAFDETLSSYVMFEDWFLRLRAASKLVMNCPDAMYFATDSSLIVKQTKRECWFSLVRKWQLNRLVLPDEVKMSFSCMEIGINCTMTHLFNRKQMMPICCMDQIAKGMKKFHELCVRNGLLYNFIGRSVLGAVKLRDIMPWEFNGDVEYYFSNRSFFENWGKLQKIKNETLYTADANVKSPGYFSLRTPEMVVEMTALNKLAADRLKTDIFDRAPTKMRIHGVWVYGPPNPGLYARNMYGKELLQHFRSWYHAGKRDWTDPYHNGRTGFVPCKNIGHHACGSRFRTDGSFQFAVP